MDHLFTPVKKVKVFQDIVSQLQEAIFSGKFKVGQALPPEKTLQAMFETNQPAVREAIRVLEYQGLVRTRSGKKSGTVVLSRQCRVLEDNLSLLMRSRRIAMDDLAEFREKIEGEAVALAAANCTDLDILQLKTLLEEAEGYSRKSGKSVRKFINADKRFHLRLCEIAGNPFYNMTLSAVYSHNPYYNRFLHLENRKMKENLQDLTDIVSAFFNHRPQEAKQISVHHICKFNSQF